MLKRIFLIVFSCLINGNFYSLFAQRFPNSTLHATHTIFINGHSFRVALALSEEERARGLMGVRHLNPEEGMLFVFEEPTYLSFWMKDTAQPLSIAYIDSQGIIKEIHDMQPYDLSPVSSCSLVLYALEVPQGVFEEKEIKINDRVEGLIKMSL